MKTKIFLTVSMIFFICLFAIPLIAFVAHADDPKNRTLCAKESGKQWAPALKMSADPSCTPVINILWQNSLGGDSNETATSIKQTPDGGYIVGGYTRSNNQDVSGNHGNIDFWLVKLFPDGTADWKYTYGGTYDDVAYGVDLAADGGYVIAGSSNSQDGHAILSGNHGNRDMFVIKVNSRGKFRWARSYGGSSADAAYDIKRTADGGYILAGFTESDDGDLVGHKGTFSGTDRAYWILKIDGSGNIASDPFQDKISFVYGGKYVDFAYSVQQTSDSGYVTSGFSRTAENDPCDENLYTIKFDKYLNPQWFSSLGAWNGEGANVIKQTSDGGYITIGLSHSFDCSIYPAGSPCMGNQDPYPSTYSSLPVDPSFHGKSHEMWVVKMNGSGVPDSAFGYLRGTGMQCYGGTQNEEGADVIQTCDGGYLLVGQSTSTDGDATCTNGGPQDAWIVKTESQGQISWQQSLGGSGDEKANSVIRCSDGSYVFAGYSTSNDNDLLDSKDVDGSGNHGKRDFWIVKFEPGSSVSCAAPSRLTKHVNNCEVTFSWTGNLCDTVYNLQYKKLQEENWTSINSASNPTILTLPESKYVWQVQSKCSPSNSSAYVTGPTFRITASCRLNTNPTEETEDEALLNKFLVYPNPNNGSFSISLELNSGIEQDARIEVLDELGRIVLSENGTVTNGTLMKEISLRKATSGLYKIRVQIGTGLYEDLLVVQN